MGLAEALKEPAETLWKSGSVGNCQAGCCANIYAIQTTADSFEIQTPLANSLNKSHGFRQQVSWREPWVLYLSRWNVFTSCIIYELLSAFCEAFDSSKNGRFVRNLNPYTQCKASSIFSNSRWGHVKILMLDLTSKSWLSMPQNNHDPWRHLNDTAASGIMEQGGQIRVETRFYSYEY